VAARCVHVFGVRRAPPFRFRSAPPM
jgi:hypothetical protein